MSFLKNPLDSNSTNEMPRLGGLLAFANQAPMLKTSGGNLDGEFCLGQFGY